MNRRQRDCEQRMREMTNGERGCADPSAHLNRLEKFLIRLGILATPEQSEVYDAIDKDIDHREMHARWLARGYAYMCDRPECPYR